MLKGNWKTFAAVGSAIALLGVGTLTASASVSTCSGAAFFTGSTVYLQEEGNSGIWSSPVTLYTYCGAVDPANALSNVTIVSVTASLPPTGAPFNGVIIPDLMASVDGSVPTTTLTTAATSLNLPSGLVSDSNGAVIFTMRAYSPTHADLAGPGGSPQLIGLQFDYGSGPGTFPGPGGIPISYPLWIGGMGGIYAQTPELDSVLLFGSGAMGMAGYALLRLRASRRRPD